jgi:hypothetical protein
LVLDSRIFPHITLLDKVTVASQVWTRAGAILRRTTHLTPPMNPLEQILTLPAELMRMVFRAILPSYLQVECIAANFKLYSFDWRDDPEVFAQKPQKFRLKYSDVGVYHPTHHVVNKAWYAAVMDFMATTTVWDLGEVQLIYNFAEMTPGCKTCRKRKRRCDRWQPGCKFCCLNTT